VSDSEHQYVDDAPAPAETKAFAGLLGHNQVNDQHLIEIARANDCLLLTADKSLIQHFLALVSPLDTLHVQ
jgi:predicted nuclease of predicted toxin-antitoxin system